MSGCAGDGNSARLSRVFELTVAAGLTYLEPAVFDKQFHHVSYFHSQDTLGRHAGNPLSRWLESGSRWEPAGAGRPLPGSLPRRPHDLAPTAQELDESLTASLGLSKDGRCGWVCRATMARGLTVRMAATNKKVLVWSKHQRTNTPRSQCHA
jgi:hypothetical protein